MEHFMDKILTQLSIMSEEEKTEWIITQARLTAEWKQEDFYKSICGTKSIIDMPEKEKIDEYCQNVLNGTIVLQYETHYVEFDDYGHFHDDWEHEFYDPSNQTGIRNHG